MLPLLIRAIPKTGRILSLQVWVVICETFLHCNTQLGYSNRISQRQVLLSSPNWVWGEAGWGRVPPIWFLPHILQWFLLKMDSMDLLFAFFNSKRVSYIDSRNQVQVVLLYRISTMGTLPNKKREINPKNHLLCQN